MKQDTATNTWSLLTQVLSVDGEDNLIVRTRPCDKYIAHAPQDARIESERVMLTLRTSLRFPWKLVCCAPVL